MFLKYVLFDCNSVSYNRFLQNVIIRSTLKIIDLMIERFLDQCRAHDADKEEIIIYEKKSKHCHVER